MNKESQEVWLQGQPISEGIAIGVPFFLDMEEDPLPTFPITMGEVDDEIARYRHALVSSRQDLQELEKDLTHQGSEDAATIIASHIEMLEDPLITTHMEEKIRQMLQNTESVFQTVLGDYHQKYLKNSDTFFQQRLIDVMDLAKRVLRHLCPDGSVPPGEIPYNSIVFANILEPSYTATASNSRVHAFVTESGGKSSHAALIARAKGIPYVICPALQNFKDVPFASAIVDGQTGDVILNPSQTTLQKYRLKKTCMKTHYHLLQRESQNKTETLDGQRIKVLANIGHLSDLSLFTQSGAEGVGLFRTEYLCFEHPSQPPTEEFQYRMYRELFERVGDKPIVLRVFDVGGDKHLDFLGPALKEPNPMLGCRGIRFLLRHPLIFKTQLRAIFRAKGDADVRILLPFVADYEEWLLATDVIAEVMGEMALSSMQVPIGCMIEIPSAVMSSDILAQKAHFLSIGTNDLFQYAMGTDRNNPVVGDSYSPIHPSVLKMIKIVVNEADRQERPLSLCGEMASDPLFISLLLGLGIREFSCSPRYVPLVKNAVRKVHLHKAKQLAEEALTLSTSGEIMKLLRGF